MAFDGSQAEDVKPLQMLTFNLMADVSQGGESHEGMSGEDGWAEYIWSSITEAAENTLAGAAENMPDWQAVGISCILTACTVAAIAVVNSYFSTANEERSPTEGDAMKAADLVGHKIQGREKALPVKSKSGRAFLSTREEVTSSDDSDSDGDSLVYFLPDENPEQNETGAKKDEMKKDI